MIIILQIDLLTPLADQGPFALIIHKLTDVITQAHLGDKTAQTMIANLQVRGPFVIRKYYFYNIVDIYRLISKNLFLNFQSIQII